VDILYHESTFLEDMQEFANKTLHSTAKEAAEIARLSNAGKLILGHFSARYKKTTKFVEEARTIFENTVAAKDGKTYSVKREKPD
jgi:ribonuclease Z